METRRKFEYVIHVNKKEVWRGLNPKEKYWDIKKKNPGKRVSVGWDTSEDVLICML